MRSLFAAAFAAVILTAQLAVPAGPAAAHHGWAWTTGGNIELTGVITAADLGNPHGELTVDVNGEAWTVEVGQPWRNERAGVQDGDLAEGVEIRVIGEPAADPSNRLLKAERFYLDGREYDLYPGRD